MSRSIVSRFNDPLAYQAAFRGADIEIYPTEAGEFSAELTKVDFKRLWMQRGRESQPRIFLGAVNPERAAVGFLVHSGERPIRNCGSDVVPGEIIVDSSDLIHRRTEGPCCWGSMSLKRTDLTRAAIDITGCDLPAPKVTHVVRPSPSLMSRLLHLHKQAGQLAKTAPGTLAKPEVSHALEQALTTTLVMCMADGIHAEPSYSSRQHSALIRRLEEFLAANHDHSVYLAEICTALSVGERTLRVCCEEHLGMGPIRYLWLRRMHLARHALVLADAAETTVTKIATDYGFWELGRFSVEYRTLFAEPPSVTLRRERPTGRQISQVRPFALAASEFA